MLVLCIVQFYEEVESQIEDEFFGRERIPKNGSGKQAASEIMKLMGTHPVGPSRRVDDLIFIVNNAPKIWTEGAVQEGKRSWSF